MEDDYLIINYLLKLELLLRLLDHLCLSTSDHATSKSLDAQRTQFLSLSSGTKNNHLIRYP